MKKSGFTLIELLVVISIIAILAVMGFAAYSGVQKNARDARRKGDIDAIASAMEANYGKTTANQYSALSSSFFSSNTVPNDPINSSTGTACNSTPCRYCYAQGTTTAPILTSCPATGGNYIIDNAPAGPSGGTNIYWLVCTNLEGGASYCRANSQ